MSDQLPFTVLLTLLFGASACSTDPSDFLSTSSMNPSLESVLPEHPKVQSGPEVAVEPRERTIEAIAETDLVLPRSDRPGMPDESSQALVVTTSAWKEPSGELKFFVRENAALPWTPSGMAPISVSVGRHGLAWGRGLHPEQQDGPLKFEGDHRSPAGLFDLGEARGYAKQPPPDTTWPFRHSGTLSRCMDNPRSQAYNSFFSTQGIPLPVSVGIASRATVFEYMLFVKHNTSPVVRGAGSCVFLHVWAKPHHPTQGCIGMSRGSMENLLSWLDLDRRPVLVQLPRDVHERFQESWSLPAID